MREVHRAVRGRLGGSGVTVSSYGTSRGRRSFLGLALPTFRAGVARTLHGARAAHIDLAACLVPVGGDCRRCVDACPRETLGILMESEGPVVQEGCDGCGDCVAACATVNTETAIRMRPAPRNVGTLSY